MSRKPIQIIANPYGPDERRRISYPYLSLAKVEKWIPEAEGLGVSRVARGPRGFVQAYRRARGRVAALPDEWVRRRYAFLARHLAQVDRNSETLFHTDGRPTRRHLALIMWAFSPTPRKI